MSNHQPDDAPLRKIQEVARRLTMSVRQIYVLVGRGELEAVHEGRAAFITTVSEQAYVERLRQRAAERRAAKATDARSKADQGGSRIKTNSGPLPVTLKSQAQT